MNITETHYIIPEISDTILPNFLTYFGFPTLLFFVFFLVVYLFMKRNKKCIILRKKFFLVTGMTGIILPVLGIIVYSFIRDYTSYTTTTTIPELSFGSCGDTVLSIPMIILWTLFILVCIFGVACLYFKKKDGGSRIGKGDISYFVLLVFLLLFLISSHANRLHYSSSITEDLILMIKSMSIYQTYSNPC